MRQGCRISSNDRRLESAEGCPPALFNDDQPGIASLPVTFKAKA